jgi:hypothetical protein
MQLILVLIAFLIGLGSGYGLLGAIGLATVTLLVTGFIFGLIDEGY